MSKDEDIKKAIPGQRYKHYKDNPISICHADKELFIEMAFCFISKHGK